MEDRITSTYKEGMSLGDLGYSNLLIGEQVSKGSAFGAIYSSVEWLQHGLLKYLDARDEDNNVLLFMKQLDTPDIVFFHWLYEALFGLSAFCYRKGNTDPEYGLLMPYRAYEYLTERIEKFKVTEEAKRKKAAETEFIALKGTLNKLRLQARDVERNYVAWFNEEVIIKEYRTKPGVFENIVQYQRFLNRLSSYFYWLIRYSALKDSNREWSEWITRIPRFPL